MKTKFTSLLFLLSALICSCSQENVITPEKIITQLHPGPGWSVKEANRPNFYQYKIAKDSGYATITVSVPKEELFGKYSYKNYETAADLAQSFSFTELKKQFEINESEDKRSIPVLNAVKDTTLGGAPALLFISDYHIIDPEMTLAIEYYAIRGREGWILIGTAFKREEETLQRKDIRDKLKTLKIQE
jgi:hypothetical protein